MFRMVLGDFWCYFRGSILNLLFNSWYSVDHRSLSFMNGDWFGFTGCRDYRTRSSWFLLIFQTGLPGIRRKSTQKTRCLFNLLIEWGKIISPSLSIQLWFSSDGIGAIIGAQWEGLGRKSLFDEIHRRQLRRSITYSQCKNYISFLSSHFYLSFSKELSWEDSFSGSCQERIWWAVDFLCWYFLQRAVFIESRSNTTSQ